MRARALFSVNTHRIHRRWIFLVFGWFLKGQLIFLARQIVSHLLPSSTALRLMDLDASGAEISSTNPTRNSWWHNIAPVRRCGQSFVVLEKHGVDEKEIKYKKDCVKLFSTFGAALQLLSWIGSRSGKNVLPHFAHGTNCSWKKIHVFVSSFSKNKRRQALVFV